MPGQNRRLAYGRTRSVPKERTEIHDVIAANRTVVHHDIPGPERDSIPLRNSQSMS